MLETKEAQQVRMRMMPKHLGERRQETKEAQQVRVRMMPKHLGRPQAGDQRSTTGEGEDDAKTSRETAGRRPKKHNR
jgi:hypothetical protein